MSNEINENNAPLSFPPTKKLLYGFAKRNQVLIQPTVPPELIYTEKTEPTMLMEVRRSLQQSVKMRMVTFEQFNTLLVSTYETNTSQTEQMAADISEELDLQSMAQELQHTEELLESADDAPIIRLINALLSQAIKENASDIHIESYEEELMFGFKTFGNGARKFTYYAGISV
jgi:general secretion pathway protein E